MDVRRAVLEAGPRCPTTQRAGASGALLDPQSAVTTDPVEAAAGRPRRQGAALLGRRREREALEQLLANARAGDSGVLVLRGEAGMGRSALLHHLTRRASGCRTTRASGVESEMELAFAGLHQLCAPFLDRIDKLPVPQREAIATAFGLHAGGRADQFLLGLAVLGLLCDVARHQPLLCVVDDAEWLDEASQTLAFVARRLAAESVVLVFGVRGSDALSHLV